MEEVSREIFYESVRTWADVPFSQSEGWIRMQSGGREERVRYFLDENIGCAAHVKRFGGLSMLMVDTECLRHKETKASTYKQFYEDLRRQGCQIVEVNSRRPYSAACEVGMRQAGYLRPVGSFSYELTKLIDLQQPVSYDENWRRHLKKTASAGLKLTDTGNPTQDDCADFVRLYEEMGRRKHLRVPADSASLAMLLADKRFRLYFLETSDKERIATILIHLRGEEAGLIYAANGAKADGLYAGFEMYRQLLETLQEAGVRVFDMEKMGASAHSTNAVYQFKNGIRGTLTALCGEWSAYRYRGTALGMYFIKKYVWHRQQA